MIKKDLTEKICVSDSRLSLEEGLGLERNSIVRKHRVGSCGSVGSGHDLRKILNDAFDLRTRGVDGSADGAIGTATLYQSV